MASRASRLLLQARMARSRMFTWPFVERRFPVMPTGCRRLNSSGKAFSSILTKPRLCNGFRPTIQRNEKLLAGYDHWQKRFAGNAPQYPGTPYVLLHSISHALMAEIALECGYPASSLKERVYALSGPRGGGDFDRCGVLIYTASAGAQGTLGGLVATAPRFAHILRSALERLRICSNDPVCADHEPDDRSGDRATHGAACYGCHLIAETSCELRNLFLDRSLLVPTMADDLSCFFK